MKILTTAFAILTWKNLLTLHDGRSKPENCETCDMNELAVVLHDYHLYHWYWRHGWLQ